MAKLGQASAGTMPGITSAVPGQRAAIIMRVIETGSSSQSKVQKRHNPTPK